MLLDFLLDLSEVGSGYLVILALDCIIWYSSLNTIGVEYGVHALSRE